MAQEQEEWPELLPKSWRIPDAEVLEVLLLVIIEITHQFHVGSLVRASGRLHSGGKEKGLGRDHENRQGL